MGTPCLSARAVAPAPCVLRWEPQSGIRAWQKKGMVSWLLAQSGATQLPGPQKITVGAAYIPSPVPLCPLTCSCFCALAEAPCPNHQEKRLHFTFCQPNSVSHFPPHATNTFLEAMHSRCSASPQLSSRRFVLLHTPCVVQRCTARELHSTAHSAAAQCCIAARGSRCRHGFGAGLAPGLSS